VDIEASNTLISDISSSSVEPSDVLKRFSSVWSNNSSVVIVEPVASSLLDGNCLVSISSSSDGSSSPVEDEPLSVVSWVGISDSESVLM